MANNKIEQNAIREIVDLYDFRERTREEVLADIEGLATERKVAAIKAYLRNIDDTLSESFDTGKWFEDITELRKNLQAQLDRYSSLEFKIEGLEKFLEEVRARLVERMKAAHGERGNDWLWRDQPQEAQEEYLDAAAYSVLLLRRLTMGKIVQTGTLGKADQKPEPEKTSLENKLFGFDKFTQLVKQRITEGDQHYGDRWLIESQPQQIQNEVLDAFAYAYFGWRKAKMLQEGQPHLVGNKPNQGDFGPK